MANIYDYQGNAIPISGGSGSAINYDATVKGVAHRGYSSAAPENTLPAYKLAKQMGFNYAETDISFTSDGVAVCLHDATIDRTSNGSGNIGSLTWAQVQQYDFGSWKSSAYAGTKIPSFEQFITLCRNIGLHPYIELKNNATYTEAQIQALVDMVNSHGMKGKVTWISFSSTYLTYVKNYDTNARIGYLNDAASTNAITTCNNLKTTTNEVFYDVGHGSITDAICTTFAEAGIPIEAWTIDNADTIKALNPYITGVTSNDKIAGQVLYDANMN